MSYLCTITIARRRDFNADITVLQLFVCIALQLIEADYDSRRSSTDRLNYIVYLQPTVQGLGVHSTQISGFARSDLSE